MDYLKHLCIWTTAVGKEIHCNYICNLLFLKNKTGKKGFIIIIIYLQNAPEIYFHFK